MRVLDVGTFDPRVLHAEIAFGQPDLGAIIQSEKLHWLHLSSAGYARYDTEEIQSALVKRHAIMTKSSHVTVEPCAQHLIAWMLADARQLYLSYENERGSHGWPQNDLREKARLLDNQVVFIVGYGAIGRRLAGTSRAVSGSSDRLSSYAARRLFV